ncbi:hypothetical protein N7448_000127 [Penicillium atrosanguineum]|nr:hypothetical protein N7448_000127 [Penicillium atrosanguineum]
MARKKPAAMKSYPNIPCKSEPKSPSKEDGIQNTIPSRELFHTLASLRLDSRYNDLGIICGADEYAMHKMHSLYAVRLFLPKYAMVGLSLGIPVRNSRIFTYYSIQHSSTNTVILQKEPAIVDHMIEYFYSLDYQNWERQAGQGSASNPDDLVEDSVTSYNPLSFHILIYSLAGRLFMKGLKALSKDKVEGELAHRLDPSTFPTSNSTPASHWGLRDLAVGMTMNHLTKLRTNIEAD